MGDVARERMTRGRTEDFFRPLLLTHACVQERGIGKDVHAVEFISVERERNGEMRRGEGEREENKKEVKEKEGPSSPYTRMRAQGEKRSRTERSSTRDGKEKGGEEKREGKERTRKRVDEEEEEEHFIGPHT